MQFHYKAVRATGDSYEATGEFDSKGALFDELKEKGDSLIFSEEVKKKSVVGWMKSINIGGVKMETKMLFARNMGAMIEAGLPISRALEVTQKQAKRGKFKQVVKQISEDVSIGKSFSDALRDHGKVFPPLFIAMVAAGEESGSLVQALDSVGEQMERSYRLKKKVKGAMMYPAIIISAMILIGVLMMVFVVPTLTATFKDLNVDLPGSTKIVIFISDTLKNQALLVFGGLAVLVGIFVAWAKTKGGRRKLEWILMRVPVVGFIMREVNIARVATTFASLLGSGVEIMRALEITKEVSQNSYYKDVIDEATETVQKGGSISSVLAKHEFLFPPLMTEMAAVGEETGKVSELFKRVGGFYESDVEEKTKNISTIIEPVLMVFIGGAVGFFAISMLTPMYSLTSGI